MTYIYVYKLCQSKPPMRHFDSSHGGQRSSGKNSSRSGVLSDTGPKYTMRSGPADVPASRFPPSPVGWKAPTPHNEQTSEKTVLRPPPPPGICRWRSAFNFSLVSVGKLSVRPCLPGLLHREPIKPCLEISSDEPVHYTKPPSVFHFNITF